MSKHILLMTTDSRMGGTEKTIYMLARHLITSGRIPHVAVLKGGGEYADKYLSTAETYTECRSNLQILFWFHELIRIIDTYHISVVYSMLFHANIINRLIKCVRPHIICVNGHRTVEMGKKWHLVIDKYTKKYVDYEIANSNTVKQFCIDRTGSKKSHICTIYNGIECGQENVGPKQKSHYTFGCIGSFSKAKGQKLLIKAFILLKEEGFDANLIMVGDGPLINTIKKDVSLKSMDEDVIFTGKLTDIMSIYHGIDCLVIPSLWEGLPNVLFEAIVNKIPVIAADIGGIKEIAAKVGSVAVFERNNAVALKEEMARFCSNPTSLTNFTNDSAEIIRKEFSVKQMVDHHLNVFESLEEKLK